MFTLPDEMIALLAVIAPEFAKPTETLDILEQTPEQMIEVPVWTSIGLA
jgi:hypothetical protein